MGARMNSRLLAAVGPLGASLMIMTGCIDVNGGAVELSWTIRAVGGDQRQRHCQDASGHGPIGAVRLVANQVECGAGCAERRPAPWACDDYHGTTRFEIPEGKWSLAIAVQCQNGTDATEPGVRVPDPIVRDIRFGEVAQLNALIILLDEQQPICAAM